MADILCFYTFSNTNESGVFVIEQNVTYDQLVEFVKSNGIIDNTYQLFSQNNEEIDEQKFNQILEDSKRFEEPTISLVFKKEGTPLYPSLASEAPVPEPEPEDSPIGPTIRQIMAKIGMNFDEAVHLEDIQECLNSIPIPYCFFVKGFLSQVRSNPSNLKTLVEQAASLFTVDSEALLKEAEVALYFLETGKLPQSEKKQAPVAKEEEKAKKKAPKPFIGPIIGSVLTHFGVNYSSLNSPENVNQIIDLLPIPINFIAKSAFQQAGENPLLVQLAVKEIAKRFDFDEDELQKEVTHILNCLNGQISEEEEESVEEEVEEPEVVLKEVLYHSAICDNCSNAIAGTRYLCLHCKTYDLCSACEKLNNEAPFHDESHVFAKIKDARAPYHPEQVLPFIDAEKNVNNNQPEPVCRRFGAAQSRMDELENQISQLKTLVAKMQEEN